MAPNVSPLMQQTQELRLRLAKANPDALALRAGAAFHAHASGGGVFQLSGFGRQLHVSYPDFCAQVAGSGRPLMAIEDALLAAYFQHASGAAVTGQWIAFSELPDGAFYAQAFQGYTGQVLVRVFGEDLPALQKAAAAAGGQPVPRSTAGLTASFAYLFLMLPQMPLLLACWEGDEDFPASMRILFDSSASAYLSTDGCAILGSLLVRRVLAYEDRHHR